MKYVIWGLLLLSLPVIGHSQYVQFSKDSIPTINGNVVFRVKFKFELTKKEFHQRTKSYLNNDFSPYAAKFNVDNEKKTIYYITDYLDVTRGFLQTFGMYMTYRIEFKYDNDSCTMSIGDISYVEKGYYESRKNNQSQRGRIPVYSAKQIMIGHKFHLMLIKKASEKITESSIKRINAIIRGLYSSYVNK